MRQPCTRQLGTALTRVHGRLDGVLVSVVAKSARECGGDADHLILQIRMQGSVYAVAVNLDTSYADGARRLPAPAWEEGWHPALPLDYVRDFSLGASDFLPSKPVDLRQRLESALASANRVAIYATGYGANGAHLVHRNGGGRDGALIVEPLSANPRVFTFRFSNQNF